MRFAYLECGVLRGRPMRTPSRTALGAHILRTGLSIAALSIGGQRWAYATGSESWRSVVFTVLTLRQLAHVLVIRSDRESVLSIGLLSNMPA